MDVAESGSPEQAYRLVVRLTRSELDVCDDQGWSAVAHAVVHNNVGALRVFLGAKANPNAKDTVRRGSV